MVVGERAMRSVFAMSTIHVASEVPVGRVRHDVIVSQMIIGLASGAIRSAKSFNQLDDGPRHQHHADEDGEAPWGHVVPSVPSCVVHQDFPISSFSICGSSVGLRSVTCKADQAAWSSRNHLGSQQPTSARAD